MNEIHKRRWTVGAIALIILVLSAFFVVLIGQAIDYSGRCAAARGAIHEPPAPANHSYEARPCEYVLRDAYAQGYTDHDLRIILLKAGAWVLGGLVVFIAAVTAGCYLLGTILVSLHAAWQRRRQKKESRP